MTYSLEPLLIRASAGTGKTTRLTTRILALLLRGEQLERILATTFTRKAAFEIRERVITRLATALQQEEARRQLAIDVELPELSEQKLQEVFQYVIENLHRFSICTLDSFISTIAGAYAFELGVIPGWRLEDDSGLDDLHRRALARVCAEVDSEDLRALIEVLARDRAVRSVSRVLQDALAFLSDVYFESPDQAWNWAAGRGEPYSAEGVHATIEALKSLELPRTKKGTIVSLWQKAVEGLITSIQAGDPRAVLEATLVQKVLNQEDTYARFPIEPLVLKVIGDVAEEAASVSLYKLHLRTRALRAMLARYIEHVQQLKRTENVYTFTDVKRFFDGKGIAGALDEMYFRIDCRIQHVLLDEFQDTSRYEWNVLEPIVAEIVSKAEGESSFFCVGDVKQAIYGWRGGVAEIFDQITERWPHVQEVPSNTSYRCSQGVLDFVNAVFSHVPHSRTLAAYAGTREKWQERFISHRAGLPKKGHVQVFEAEQAEEIDQLLEPAKEGLLSVARAHPGMSIGVLVRTNQEVADTVAWLRQSAPDVAVSQEGGVPLASYPPVAAILSLFELLDHPADTVCWYHVCHSMLVTCRGVRLDGSVPARSRALAKLRQLLLAEGIPAFLSALLVSLESRLERAEYQQIQKLSVLSRSYADDSGLRPSAFVDWVRRQKDEASQEATVRVMTVHQSKGLEFDAVFLPVLTSKFVGRDSKIADVYREHPLQPPVRICLKARQSERAVIPELAEAASYEEEGRVTESLSVLYVALTRARHALYLVLAPDSSDCTWSGLIREVLLETSPMQDASWSDELSISVDTRVRQEIPARLHFQGRRRQGRGLEYTTASQQEKSLLSVRSLLQSQTHAGVAHGRRVHALLQHVGWVSPARKIDWLADFVQSDEQLQEIQAIVSRGDVGTVFSKAAYEEVAGESFLVTTEKRFAFIEENTIFSGAIDRLVVRYSAAGKAISAEVIDFKSDTVRSEEDLESRVRTYEPQLAVYRKAAARLTGVAEQDVSSRLVFLHSGQVVACG